MKRITLSLVICVLVASATPAFCDAGAAKQRAANPTAPAGDEPPYPEWADGVFSATVSAGTSAADGSATGYVVLGRTDADARVNGTATVDAYRYTFNALIKKRLVVGLLAQEGGVCAPFVGRMTVDGDRFSTLLVRLGGSPLIVNGTYDASFLPAPDGPYAVGSRLVHLLDESRAEKLSENPDDRREIMVRLWYPRPRESDGERVEYMGPETFAWLRSQSPVPLFWIQPDAYTYVHTHAVADAPVDDSGPFPVVVFSHGYRGYPAMYTAFNEELASHGFVVAAINHPYIAGITVFPNGRTIELPDLSGRDEAYVAWYFETAYEEMLGDIGFVLEYLSTLAETDPLWQGCLDMDAVGMYGHSFGGGATAATCRADSRVRAGLTLDAYVPDAVNQTGWETPILMLFVEGRFEQDAGLQAFWDLLTADAYRGDIAGSGHQDFTDLPVLLSHLTPRIPRGLLGFGTITPKRLLNIVNGFTVTFFSAYLRDGPVEDIIAVADAFDEVTFHYK
jgi:dienelactone hydrolase